MVRKTRPKIETPFKVYICCTKDEPKYHSGEKFFVNGWDDFGNGKVVGEFVCDRIEETTYRIQEPEDAKSWQDCYYGYDFEFVCSEAHCLSKDELYDYGNKKPLYGWHISDLVIYNKPKELNEFQNSKGDPLLKPFQSWGYICLK